MADFSRLAPGPMAAMMLGDLGADVVKIEEPGGGRRAREERALGRSDELEEQRWRQLSPLDRNKRSIALNLREPAGREVALALIERSDVLIEGYRPGVMGRLGLDYDSARSRNRRLVYCSISGFGQAGPKAASVGHDLNYLAYAGALSLIGTPDGRPVVPINVIGDYAAGSLVAVAGILAALVARTTSGEGQLVDVSMVDGVVALLAVEVARLLHTGKTPRSGSTYLTGGVAYYNLYEAKDGGILSIGCNEPHFFRRLCELLDLPDLPALQFHEEAQGEIAMRLQERFRQMTLSEWLERLHDSEIPVAPARRLDDVIADPDLKARGLILEVGEDGGRPVTQIGSPFRLSATPVEIRRPAPRPGEQTAEVLAELGFNEAAITRLAQDGVIGAP